MQPGVSRAKKQKLNFEDSNFSTLTIPNPFGVEPTGNQFLENSKNTRLALGKSLSRFNEGELINLLEVLGPLVCARLAGTCRFLYVHCTANEDLWRKWTLATFNGEFIFKVNWRNTFKFMACPDRFLADAPIKVKGFYSDLLHLSWRCQTVPLSSICHPEKNTIDRRCNLSLQEFLTEYAIPQKPVIITDIVKNWPAYKKWNLDFFNSRSKTQKYRAEAVDITFSNYLDYFKQAQEESPLYLFDKLSLKQDKTLANDYQVPDYFSQDLFQVLGQDKRPDYRWIIIGPERSGSTFHIDPNATCAWNAVIKGAKKWILTKPNHPPPGVYPSKDGSEVTSPVSLCEWYLTYYQELQNTSTVDSNGEQVVFEGVCNEGEIIFVPCQYWHSVLNLQDSIAITQNFVADYNIQQVLEFCKFKPNQVSGFCTIDNLYTCFSEKLKELNPLVWKDKVNHEKLQRKEQKEKSKWMSLTGTNDSHVQDTGFAFSFVPEEEEE